MEDYTLKIINSIIADYFRLQEILCRPFTFDLIKVSPEKLIIALIGLSLSNSSTMSTVNFMLLISSSNDFILPNLMNHFELLGGIRLCLFATVFVFIECEYV